MLNTCIIQAALVSRSGHPQRRAHSGSPGNVDEVAATALQACSMDWWQGLSDADQWRWLQHADSDQPRNAYVCYLNHEHDRLTRTLGRIEAVGKELNRMAEVSK